VKKYLVLTILLLIISCSPPSVYQHMAKRLGLDADKYVGQDWQMVCKDLLENNFKVVKPKVGVFRMLNFKLKGLDVWVAYKGLDRYVKHSCIALPFWESFMRESLLEKIFDC